MSRGKISSLHVIWSAQEQIAVSCFDLFNSVFDAGTGGIVRAFLQLGGVSGQRVVFDEEGTALEPLAALALGQGQDKGSAGSEPGSEEAAGEGVYVVAQEAGQRFSMAAQLMKQ